MVSLDSENININTELKVTLFIVAVMEHKHLSDPNTVMEWNMLFDCENYEPYFWF